MLHYPEFNYFLEGLSDNSKLKATELCVTFCYFRMLGMCPWGLLFPHVLLFYLAHTKIVVRNGLHQSPAQGRNHFRIS